MQIAVRRFRIRKAKEREELRRKLAAIVVVPTVTHPLPFQAKRAELESRAAAASEAASQAWMGHLPSLQPPKLGLTACESGQEPYVSAQRARDARGTGCTARAGLHACQGSAPARGGALARATRRAGSARSGLSGASGELGWGGREARRWRTWMSG